MSSFLLFYFSFTFFRVSYESTIFFCYKEDRKASEYKKNLERDRTRKRAWTLSSESLEMVGAANEGETHGNSQEKVSRKGILTSRRWSCPGISFNQFFVLQCMSEIIFHAFSIRRFPGRRFLTKIIKMFRILRFFPKCFLHQERTRNVVLEKY